MEEKISEETARKLFDAVTVTEIAPYFTVRDLQGTLQELQAENISAMQKAFETLDAAINGEPEIVLDDVLLKILKINLDTTNGIQESISAYYLSVGRAIAAHVDRFKTLKNLKG